MSRCQHCNKLTHSEDFHVEFDVKDYDKIVELRTLENWRNPWEDSINPDPKYLGRLKCGEIWIHFFCKEDVRSQ